MSIQIVCSKFPFLIKDLGYWDVAVAVCCVFYIEFNNKIDLVEFAIKIY